MAGNNLDTVAFRFTSLAHHELPDVVHDNHGNISFDSMRWLHECGGL